MKYLTIELGNIGSEEKAKRIHYKLNGKTYFDFIVDFSPAAGNWPVSVSTTKKGAKMKDFREMLLFVMASEL